MGLNWWLMVVNQRGVSKTALYKLNRMGSHGAISRGRSFFVPLQDTFIIYVH